MLCLGINPRESVRSQHCTVDSAVSGALQRGPLGQQCCSGTQMPHEWVKWGDKRVRTRQQQRGIAQRSSSSEALPLSSVTLLLHGRTRQQVLHGLFFFFYNSVLIALNVGRSGFLSQGGKLYNIPASDFTKWKGKISCSFQKTRQS